MRPFRGRRILLGVTGGIASYKSVFVARDLTLAGAEVDVVMTSAATEFVGRITFEAVTGRPVHTELLAAGHALDHVRLAKAADAIVVAPATADFLARAAHGHAGDLLTAALLATEASVMLVPAMNDRMWAHPQTVANVRHLRDLGYRVIDPDEGMLAAGEGSGPGRMPEPAAIVAHLGRLLDGGGPLSERRVVVTAGPTREAVDPVRFLSNHSSGRMGAALAAAAWRRGADVTLVHGPLGVDVPIGVRAVPVESTRDMCEAVATALATADALVMAAAPADFAPRAPGDTKLKKGDGPPALELENTPDILLATRASRRPHAIIVGFALETGDPRESAREKLERKGLDLVVANDALEAGAGFGGETNRVTLLDAKGGEEALPLMSKDDVAEAILDRVAALMEQRRGR